MKKKLANNAVSSNKKAFHNYFILEKFEAGIVLQGTEVKSLRMGKVNLKESHAAIDREELFLYNCNISPYDFGNLNNHEPTRKRKLLMHKKEISKLIGKIQEKGLSLIPLKMYFKKSGIAKIEIGLAKGKKLFDKRETLKKKTAEREISRALRDNLK